MYINWLRECGQPTHIEIIFYNGNTQKKIIIIITMLNI